MFTVVKVRDDLAPGDYGDPGWYQHPKSKLARRVSDDPNFGSPARHRPAAASGAPGHHTGMPDMPGMKHGE